MDSYIGRKKGPNNVLISKNNIQCKFEDDNNTYLLIGGASSEIVSGEILRDILMPTLDYFSYNMECLERNIPVKPLSLHTSIGLSPSINEFLLSLEPHIPISWKKEKDWVVTLQVEGSSAVHAAVDIIFQKNIQSGNYSKYIAVGESSYHGPSSTSFGNGGGSHFVNIKQVTYPVPQIKYKRKDESWSNFLDRIEKNLYKFLEENYNEIKIVLIEPQWGSAGEGQFWPVDLLRKFVNMARQYGIYVISDEIMCGLGRHGRGKTFLVDSLNIEVDAILFGKSIATGAFPLSGAILKEGFNYFQKKEITPLQSHTYSHGANILALLSAIQVLNYLPNLIPNVKKIGACIGDLFDKLKPNRNIYVSGQGCLWGIYINYNNLPFTKEILYKKLHENRVIVYFIPHGILITPIYNSKLKLIKEAITKIIKVLNILITQGGKVEIEQSIK
tara:strand:+ start:87 stop:1418 length:1332 start_codon:yes stop_codon:yes gene_type:complete